ncbi:MAG: YceI family protein [Fimbriimonadaceae bacterium]
MSTTSWTLDPPHSDLLFSIRHLGISTVRGKISGLSGTATFDSADPKTLKLHVDIDPATIDTGNEQRDAHIKSADFLDVQNYPTITFQSTRVAPAGPNEGKLFGELTIRGVTKEVELAVEGPSKEITDPYGNVKIGASATGAINRKDFGISFNHVMEAGTLLLGEELKVTIDLQFTKQASG